MAIKKFKFGVAVGVHDPSQDVDEVRDMQTGALIMQGSKGLRLVPAGEEIELEEAEGARIEAIHPNSYQRWLMYQEASRLPAGVKRLG